MEATKSTIDFYQQVKKAGHLVELGEDYNGKWSEDFRFFAEQYGWQHEDTTFERDDDGYAARYIVTYIHPEIDANLVVRHVAHTEGSSSSWRLSAA